MRRFAGVWMAVVLAIAVGHVDAATVPAWMVVDYGDVVDRRQPTHSGEPVGFVLDRLDGRALPAVGERPQDRLDHTLLDPWVEPYAAVLPDALERVLGAPDRPFAEVAWRWSEGEAQPAWVELLRARRYGVESDGAGRVRVFAPVDGAPDPDAATSARDAWRAARPVLRHVLGRLADESGGTVVVDVHAYVHRPERSAFLLGTTAHRVSYPDGDPASDRPPLDRAAWSRFLDSGLTLEGARLTADGHVRLFGSDRGRPATVLGAPISMADVAVAYRAIFHGGLAEPYMSLDRGHGPESSVVNYGGRLRDTRFGEVALRCDVRFKTFSLGLDVLTGEDLRDRLRERLPSFRTHLERFAEDPDAAGVLSQQTRLWFYPDAVDLTLSAQGDVLALRRVRMSAASQRLEEGSVESAGGEEPPWTRATIDAVNRDYDALAESFPELHDLDQVIRWLGLFTWLRQAASDGLEVPDLDALLDEDLPAVHTPRTFPQLMAFNALPPPGRAGDTVVHARGDVHAALARLRPPGREPLPGPRRLRRALQGLDRSVPEEAALAEEIGRYDLAGLSEAQTDFLAYRAERLRMHRLVLTTLPAELSGPLTRRARAGERLRAFSVSIGGLDLGLGDKLATAPGRSLRWGAADDGVARRIDRAARDDPSARPTGTASAADLPSSPSPSRPLPPAARLAVEVTGDRGEDGRRVRILADPAGPGARLREVVVPGGAGAPSYRRFDAGREIAYRIERDGSRLRLVAAPRGRSPAGPASTEPEPGAIVLEIGAPGPDGSEPDRSNVPLRWRMPDGTVRLDGRAREDLIRIVLGPGIGSPDESAPAPPVAAGAGGVDPPVLVRPAPGELARPWDAPTAPRPPEESAGVVARALRSWWAESTENRAVAVGTRPGASRGARTAVGRRATLIVPDAAFSGVRHPVREALVTAWDPGDVRADPGRRVRPLTVVASDEPPDRLAARALDLAADPRMSGKLLAIVAVGVEVRADLPARMLEAGDLVGVGVWRIPPTEAHAVGERMRRWREAIDRAGKDAGAADVAYGPVWYF